jgi:hypothetical protein
MSSNIANIDQILASLAAAFGHADVRTACLKYASRKSAPETASPTNGLAKLFSSASSVVSESESIGSSVSSKKSKNHEGKKEKKESKPRGQSSWNIAVQETLTEMRDAYMETYVTENPEATEDDIKKATEKAVTYKMAFARASEKKREADPTAQAKYEENKAKRLAKKAEKASAKVPATVEEAAKIPLPASSKTSAVGDAE